MSGTFMFIRHRADSVEWKQGRTVEKSTGICILVFRSVGSFAFFILKIRSVLAKQQGRVEKKGGTCDEIFNLTKNNPYASKHRIF